MDCFDDAPADLVVVDTCSLGLAATTPLVRLTAFDGTDGRLPARRLPFHRMLFAEERLAVRLRRADAGAGAGSELLLHRGDAVVLPAGTEMGLDWNGRLRGIGVFVDGDGLRAFARMEMGLAVDGVDFEGNDVLRDGEVAEAVIAVRNAVLADGPARRVVVESLSRVFLALIVGRHGQLADPAAAAFGRDRMRRLRDFVGERLHGSPHVAEMAGAMGMSTSAFGRALRAATGLTPMAFVREARVERAKAMLWGDASLGEIAARCGYADQAHFTRSFKAATGLTPRAWRLAGHGGSGAGAAGTSAAPAAGREGTVPAGDGITR